MRPMAEDTPLLISPQTHLSYTIPIDTDPKEKAKLREGQIKRADKEAGEEDFAGYDKNNENGQPVTIDKSHFLTTTNECPTSHCHISTESLLFRCFIFCLTVCTTSFHLFIYEAALWNPVTQKKQVEFLPWSLQVCYYALSVAFGNIISYLICGKQGLANCWNVRAILFVFPSAAILAFVEMMDPFILERIHASARAVVFQLRLPIFALIMAVVLKKNQTPIQWIFIFGVTLSVTGFSLASALTVQNYEAFGLFLCFIQACFTAIGSIVSEVTFKNLKYPFFTQIAQARLLACLSSTIALVVYCWTNNCFHLIFFHGWTYRIFLLTLWLMIRDWIQTYTIKLLSALWKALASALALCLTYAIQVSLQKKPCNPILIIFTLSVILDIVGYALTKHYDPTLQKIKNRG